MSNPKRNRPAKSSAPAVEPPARARRGRAWTFRIAGALLLPLFIFGLLEGALRLAGVGYPTRFLLPIQWEQRRLWAQNNQFGWRFFGRQMARLPYPIALPRSKAPGTVRIFVFGESAAYGDPAPRFGLSRMLQVMLRLRHPGVRFEVVNAAMTGINSNVILPIAQDCAGADGDIWVVYMGNNEVVGPFGAGTVFGSGTLPLPLIRARTGLLQWRTAQWIDSASRQLRRSSVSGEEWGGMRMFLDHPVRADAPALRAVYEHFARNLSEIIDTGRHNGARIVVSTVAVNLRDCAPFASVAGPSQSDDRKAQWGASYRSGLEAAARNDWQRASELFQQNAEIDGMPAELRFRQGECALELGQVPKAQAFFRQARDLDALRFRCDTRLNELIRKVVTDQPREDVVLADAEAAFAAASPQGLPGRPFFCDHVHFTLEGTHLLARTIAAEVEKLLQVRDNAAGSPSWPGIEECAQQLGWNDWDRQSALEEILHRRLDPPFVNQANQAAELDYLRRELRRLQSARTPGQIKRAEESCRAAVAAAPEDAELHLLLAQWQNRAEDSQGAAASLGRAVALLPTSPNAWSQLGRVQAEMQQFSEASVSFRRALDLDSQDVWARQNLAQSLIKLGRTDEALQQYQRALKDKPRFGMAWLGMGQLLEARGEKSQAETCYRQALTNQVNRPGELETMARFCRSRGWTNEARETFSRAVELSPSDPHLRLEFAQLLSSIGQHAAAAAQSAEAVQLAPGIAEAHFTLGLCLGRLGRAEEALREFQETVRLKPELVEARLNLGIALRNLGRKAEALAEFQGVLERDRTNPVARQQVEALRPTRSD